jgi:ABC-type nitrate/sulfonate/bicarbonate transport system permease component
MTWYLAAYAVFWAVLFGYLMGVSSRQQKLVERAENLRVRLAERAPDDGGVS